MTSFTRTEHWIKFNELRKDMNICSKWFENENKISRALVRVRTKMKIISQAMMKIMIQSLHTQIINQNLRTLDFNLHNIFRFQFHKIFKIRTSDNLENFTILRFHRVKHQILHHITQAISHHTNQWIRNHKIKKWINHHTSHTSRQIKHLIS